jgi:hypothetical protein
MSCSGSSALVFAAEVGAKTSRWRSKHVLHLIGLRFIAMDNDLRLMRMQSVVVLHSVNNSQS